MWHSKINAELFLNFIFRNIKTACILGLYWQFVSGRYYSYYSSSSSCAVSVYDVAVTSRRRRLVKFGWLTWRADKWRRRNMIVVDSKWQRALTTSWPLTDRAVRIVDVASWPSVALHHFIRRRRAVLQDWLEVAAVASALSSSSIYLQRRRPAGERVCSKQRHFMRVASVPRG